MMAGRLQFAVIRKRRRGATVFPEARCEASAWDCRTMGNVLSAAFVSESGFPPPLASDALP